jgi:hypothetical protein
MTLDPRLLEEVGDLSATIRHLHKVYRQAF